MSSSSKTALLITDMQNFFLPTQHGHPPSDFEEPITNQLVRKWGKDGSLHINTLDWQLIPDIQRLVDEAMEGGKVEQKLIPKNTYDAFLGTRLEESLRNEGVERCVIVGVMTDCCCDTTGRSAFNRGFETWMVSDATGSTGKGQHEAGLKAWGFGYGDVINMDEVMRRLS